MTDHDVPPPATPRPEEQCARNTDRELWREPPGDYYAASIHVTEGGGIGINCGGTVIVMSLRQWHALAPNAPEAPTAEGTRSASSHSEVIFEEAYQLGVTHGRQQERMGITMEGFAGLPEKDQPSNLPQASSVRPDAGIDDGHLAAQAIELIDALERALWRKTGNTWEANQLARVTVFLQTHCVEPQQELATLRSTHATLQRALRQYGQHLVDCELKWRWSKALPGGGAVALSDAERAKIKCTCGLDLALNGAPGTE